MKQVLSILVRNQPGVLVRVASMFSRRGFNIDSLTVGVTQNPDISRMTVAIFGNEAVMDQVVKQLAKLVVVLSVKILPLDDSVTRGMALVKVNSGNSRTEVLKLAEVFRANVVDLKEQTTTFEITGDENKILAFTDVLKPFGILEMIRTGLVGLERGTNIMYQWEEKENEQNVL